MSSRRASISGARLRIVEDSGLRAPLTYLDLPSAELTDGILRFPVIVKPLGPASLAIELALISRNSVWPGPGLAAYHEELPGLSVSDGPERCVLVQEMLRGDSKPRHRQ